MTHYRPPSIDRLENPVLKECPVCGNAEPIDIDAGYIKCYDCGASAPTIHKWNSIPRQSEVMELFMKMNTLAESMKLSIQGLLSMIDEDILRATWQNDGSVLPTTIQDLGTSLQEVYDYADKLRKEWKL